METKSSYPRFLFCSQHGRWRRSDARRAPHTRDPCASRFRGDTKHTQTAFWANPRACAERQPAGTGCKRTVVTSGLSVGNHAADVFTGPGDAVVTSLGTDPTFNFYVVGYG